VTVTTNAVLVFDNVGDADTSNDGDTDDDDDDRVDGLDNVSAVVVGGVAGVRIDALLRADDTFGDLEWWRGGVIGLVQVRVFGNIVDVLVSSVTDAYGRNDLEDDNETDIIDVFIALFCFVISLPLPLPWLSLPFICRGLLVDASLVLTLALDGDGDEGWFTSPAAAVDVDVGVGVVIW
jgi:hypothetical protein